MTDTPPKRHILDIPPLYLLLAIALTFLLDRLVPIVDLVDRPLSYLGYVSIIAGIGLAAWGRWSFSKAGTNVVPFTPSTALVQDGPFRFTRNPMYLGMMLVLAGCFFLAGSLGSFSMIPVFFWWIQKRFVLREEDHMIHHFSDDYLAYKERVRRWL